MQLYAEDTQKEPSPLGKGNRSGRNREYLERFSDAVAVDEVHRTDAPSHLCK